MSGDGQRPNASAALYGQLFRAFFRVGILTFGGGYAMLPILRRELVESHPWCTDEELADYYAVGQCTPGIIAVNTATFVGQKLAGIPGALLTTFSVTLPSLIIILIIAAALQNFADYAVVKNAFAGIRVAVTALVLNAVLKLLKTAVVDKLTLAVFLAVFLLASVFSVSPVVYVLAAGLAGIAVKVWGEAAGK
ncbi:MAG: chromate transporter [Oscillospiraceae bacterium]|nr:chromate transporter [Oscillospiraceae bacterium]